MSWVRNLAAFFVAIAAFAVGSVASNYALQFKALSEATNSAPEQTTAASLATKGPGSKIHLELTDFKFGEPLIETNGEQWEGVWLPLVPTSGKATAPAVFFRTTRVRDQAQLDELREQTSVRVFVTNTSLQRSVWGAAVTKDLYAKYPNIDFDKLTLLGEPDLEVPLSEKLAGKRIVLSTDVLLSPVTRSIAWGVCGGSFMIGVILAILMITPIHRVDVTELRCRADRSETGTAVTNRYLSSIPARNMKSDDVQRERERLMTEHPVSSHQYKATGMVTSVAAIVLVSLAFVGVFGGVLFGTSRAGEFGPVSAGGMGVAAASAFMFFVYFCKRSLALAGKFADVIQLCNSGIRWQVGKQVRMAAWSEIAQVERVTIDVNTRKQVMAAQFGLVGALAASMGSAGDECDLMRQRDTVTVQLQDGHVMIFSEKSLTDYVTFATTLHEVHGNEAKRFAGGVEHGLIARAFIMPGAASRATMFNNRS